MSNENRKLVTIYKAPNQTRAEFIWQVLQNAGIQAQVSGDHQAGMPGLGMIPVEVLIFESDEKAAKVAIKEAETREENVSES